MERAFRRYHTIGGRPWLCGLFDDFFMLQVLAVTAVTHYRDQLNSGVFVINIFTSVKTSEETHGRRRRNIGYYTNTETISMLRRVV